MDIKKLVRMAATQLMGVAPLHGGVVMNCRLRIESIDAPAATNGVDTIYIDPDYMTTGKDGMPPFLDPAASDTANAWRLATVLAHEAEHILRLANRKRAAIGKRHADMPPQLVAWALNVAQDMRINESVLRLPNANLPGRRISLADVKAAIRGKVSDAPTSLGYLYDERLKGRSEEDLAALLLEEIRQHMPQAAGGQQSGAGQQSGSAGGQQDDDERQGGQSGAGQQSGSAGGQQSADGQPGTQPNGGTGRQSSDSDVMERLRRAMAGNVDSHEHFEESTEEQQRKARQVVERAIATARARLKGSKDRGLLPLGMEALLDAGLPAPQVDWRKLLARAVQQAMNGQVDFTTERPDRVRVAMGDDVLGFGTTRIGVSKLAFIIDTSASMEVDEIRQVIAELRKLLRSMPPDEVVIIHADAEVQHVEEVRFGAFVPQRLNRLHGGGGTAFMPALREAAERGAEFIVYATDGHGEYPERFAGPPVVWLCTTGARPAAFGKVVPLDI